jgi:hypothetical protein
MLQPMILRVEPLSDFKLKLEYETGEIKLFDAKPFIKGSFCGELGNESYFKAVRAVKTHVEWPHGQDIAPEALYETSQSLD